MRTIYELRQAAERLRRVTETDSVSPEDVFGLQSEVLEYLAAMKAIDTTGTIGKEIEDEMDISAYTLYSLYITESLTYKSSTDSRIFFLPVVAGEKIRLYADDDYMAGYSFSVDDSHQAGAAANLVKDTGRYYINKGEVKDVEIPDGCNFLVVRNDNVSIVRIKRVARVRFVPPLYEVVDNLTKGGADKPLSAEQGKVLAEKVSKLEDRTTITEELTAPYNIGYMIDARTDSPTFGKPVKVGSTNYGSSDFIDVKGREFINIIYQYASTSASYYDKYGSVFYDEDKRAITEGAVVIRNGAGEMRDRLAVPIGASYVRITSWLPNASAVSYTFEDSIKDVVVKLNGTTTGGITGASNFGNMLPLIQQSRFVKYQTNDKALTLLHFSDIHGDAEAAAIIRSFYDKYKTYIDDMVNTGDTVKYYSGDGIAHITDNNLQRALFVLGNHDGCLKTGDHVEGSADWDAMGKEWDYDTYFAPFVSGWNVTQPSGVNDLTSPDYKACYWYKDYPDAKIRLIGLDAMHFNDTFWHTTSEQENWFGNVLAELLDETNAAYGYSVVVLCHYTADGYEGNNETWNETLHRFVYNKNANGGRIMDEKTGQVVTFHHHANVKIDMDKRFCTRSKIANASAEYGYDKGPTSPLLDVIEEWITGGGKFVAWLCGHMHVDCLYYPKMYPNIPCITIDQAGFLRGGDQAERRGGSNTHACANLITFDTANGLIKIVRVGYNMDKFLREKNYLCYDYKNRMVISNR